MVAQDVIRVLFLLNLQNREHSQVILAPTGPTSPRTLLSKQLFYGSTRCDVPTATFPCVQQQQLVTPAPTGPTDPRARFRVLACSLSCPRGLALSLM